MRICFTCSEAVPFVKTGGLADVSGALPAALSALGCEVKVFLPLYGSIATLDHELTRSEDITDLTVTLGDRVQGFAVWHKKDADGVDYHFIDCPYYYHRPELYTSDADEDERFFLLQHAAFTVMQRYAWSPDVIHCNDWQTALMPVFAKELYGWDSLFSQTGSVLSIHNIGYQGRFPDSSLHRAGLSYDKYTPGGPFEFHDSFSTLKAGILYADMVTTVSETYAREIQTEAYGAGMEGVLRVRADALTGILNGIDTTIWNPSVDKLIPQRYSVKSPARKKKNKLELLKTVGLPEDAATPVIGLITRLAVQKGIELLQPVLSDLVQGDVRFVILGSGEAKYEDFFRWAASTFPEKVAAYIGFNNDLAHLITAGADMFLMPSRYEPCGLNQMYSLNYGTIPIIRKTGGLADTVHDYHEEPGSGNGFSFNDFTPSALKATIDRALSVFSDPAARKEMIARGMSADFSWANSAAKYISVYEEAISRR